MKSYNRVLISDIKRSNLLWYKEGKLRKYLWFGGLDMCAKISEKMVACRGIYEETYEQLAQLKNGQSILMHEDYFSQFTYPLRRAAQSEGLKMTSGKIYRKNNHGSSHILIFPKSISVFVLDVGGLFHWSDTLAISAQYQRQEHTYQIEKIMSFKDCQWHGGCR